MTAMLTETIYEESSQILNTIEIMVYGVESTIMHLGLNK